MRLQQNLGEKLTGVVRHSKSIFWFDLASFPGNNQNHSR